VLYGFAVGIHKSAGMLGAHAFELFPENFNILGPPAFVMAGRGARVDVVVNRLGELLIPVLEFAEVKKIKNFKQPIFTLNPHVPKVVPVVGKLSPGGHVWRELVFVQVRREFQCVFTRFTVQKVVDRVLYFGVFFLSGHFYFLFAGTLRARRVGKSFSQSTVPCVAQTIDLYSAPPKWRNPVKPSINNNAGQTFSGSFSGSFGRFLRL
jgi:hypothetical protein